MKNISGPLLLFLFRSYLFGMMVLFCITAVGCVERSEEYYQGYAEGDFVQVSSSFGGRLETLSVSRGMSVAKGDPLFTLDRAYESAAVAEAEQVLRRAENRTADMTKGRRSSEMPCLLSGFMFPFRGMPVWAQWVGEILPLTHYLRIVRGIILKGNTFEQILPNLWPISLFLIVSLTIGLKRYRGTLD